MLTNSENKHTHTHYTSPAKHASIYDFMHTHTHIKRETKSSNE